MTIEATERTGIGLGRGGRMSRQRKRDAVLRLLRGENLEVLSRALGVTAATLSGWQDSFLSSDLLIGPRMAASFGIELEDGLVNGAIEVIRAGEGLMCEVMPLEVAPDPF